MRFRNEKLFVKVGITVNLQLLPLTRALKGFFLGFKPAFWWTSINRYHGFSRVVLEKILFSISWALGTKCRGFSRFCNILPQYLTPLLVKITGRKNSLSVSRRKLKLSTYLHTVSYNHISFLNRSQLWVLASSGFYSITWRVISSKIHFRKQPPFRGNVFPFGCVICCFFEFMLASWLFSRPRVFIHQINKQPENRYVNYGECFGYFTQLAETSSF